MDDQFLHIQTTEIKDLPLFSNYYPYEPTPYEVLDLCFDNIELAENDCFVDFGCGKGRVVFYVNHRYQIETVGIELNKDYVQDALHNKMQYSKVHQLAGSPVNFMNIKAEQYKIQLKDNVFFFFNPFSVQIFRKVIHNILKSQQRNLRKIYVILYYPSFEYIQYLKSETKFKIIKDVLVPNSSAYNTHERIMIFENQEDC